MKERTSTIEKTKDPSGLTHILSVAAISIQRSTHQESAVFESFRDNLSGVGLRGGISLLDASGDNVIVRVIAYPSAVMRVFPALERLTGLRAEGFSIPLNRVDAYRDVVSSGQPKYVSDSRNVILQMLPESARPVAGRIQRLFGQQPAIFAPLVSEGQVRGVLNIVGADLTPADVPAVTAFAGHIAVALDNVRLYTHLKAAEQRYRSLFNRVPLGLYRSTQQGEILDANPALVEMLGYHSKEDLLSVTADDLYVTPGDRERFVEAMIKNQTVRHFEVRLRRRDGTSFWAEVDAVSTVDPDGGEYHYEGSLQDISQRKEAEEAVRLSNRAYRTLSECRQAVVRASDERELLREVCQAIVGVGGYRAAWAGLIEEEDSRSVRPLEWAGPDDEILSLSLEWTEETSDGNPGGVTFWLGKTGVQVDLQKQPPYALVQDEAITPDQAVLMILPLVADARIFGALVVHSENPEAFYEQEISLLTKLVVDLSYGIRALRTQAERHEKEMALRESEERFRGLVEHSPLAIEIYDMGGTLVEVNSAWEKLWGTRGETVVGVYNCLENPQLEQLGLMPFIKRAFAGEDVQLPDTNFDPSQSSLPGQSRWVRSYVYHLRDKQGSLENVVLMHEDISEHIAAQAAIRESEERYRGIFEGVNDAIFVEGMAGEILDVNTHACEMFGWSREEFLTKNVLDLVPSEDFLVKPEDIVAKAAANRPIETTNVRANGEQFPAELMAQLQTIGGETYMLVVLRDISERKHQEALARQQDRLAAVGQLAAGIAHDFNNIMAVIVLYSQMYLLMPELPEKMRDHLGIVVKQANRAAELIQQILDFSRRAVLERRPMELVPFLKEQTKLLKRTLPENIEISVKYGSDAYRINADPTRLQQVLMNLALNARDVMPHGGQLEISLEALDIAEPQMAPIPTQKPGTWLRLTVSDTGTGIAPDVLPKVFDPFFTTKSPGQGTGLGLSQVHGIVKQHEGEIDVESRLGSGTTFSIYLPAVPVADVTSTYDEPSTLLLGQGEVILLVEDDQSTRRALKEALENLNYRVLETANGNEALSKFDAYREEICLVMSDVVMPEMGGLALLQELRARQIEVPVMLLTGHPLDKNMEELTALGEVDWQSKPIHLSKLSNKIAQLLETAGSIDSM